MPLGMSNFELAQLGLAGATGVAGAVAGGGQRKENRADQARAELQAILSQIGGYHQDRLDTGRNDAVNFAAAQGPLGGEQRYVQRNNVMRSILPGLASQQPLRSQDPNIARLQPQQSNPLAGLLGGDGQLRPDIATTFSDNATSRAITDRRQALARLNPNFDFQPLSDYGLTQDADAFHQEVVGAGQETQALRDEEYAAIEQVLGRQLSIAERAQAEQETKKSGGGGGFWKSLAKIGMVIGGAALTATGIGGPAGAALIGAGVGAGTGAIDGGWKGALMGGGLGAVSGGLAGGSGAAGGTSVRNAILNPQTLGRAVGAGVGGPAGQAIGMASSFLPGARPNAPRMPGGAEGNVNLANFGMLPGGTQGSQVPPVGPAFLNNSFNPMNSAGAPFMAGPQQPAQVRGPGLQAASRPPRGAPGPLAPAGPPVQPPTPPGAPAGWQGPPMPPAAPGAAQTAPAPRGPQMANVTGPNILQQLLGGPGGGPNFLSDAAAQAGNTPGWSDRPTAGPTTMSARPKGWTDTPIMQALGGLIDNPVTRAITQQPAVRALGTPAGMLMNPVGALRQAPALARGAGTAFNQTMGLNQQLGNVAGDLSKSGVAAADDVMSQLMELFKGNPALARVFLGGK